MLRTIVLPISKMARYLWLVFMLVCRPHLLMAQTNWHFVVGDSTLTVSYDSVRVRQVDTPDTYEIWEKLEMLKAPSDSLNIPLILRWGAGMRSLVMLMDIRCSDLATREMQESAFDANGGSLSMFDATTPDLTFSATTPGTLNERASKQICSWVKPHPTVGGLPIGIIAYLGTYLTGIVIAVVLCLIVGSFANRGKTRNAST